MFERREQIEKWFNDIVQRFRQKGALAPDKAMTAQELELPPRFEQAMKRRLGRLGVFIEVDGKYYLSEEKLKQIQEMRSARGRDWNPRNRIISLRLAQLAIVAVLVIVFFANLLIQSWELRVLSAILLVALLIMVVLQIYYLSRARRKFAFQQGSQTRSIDHTRKCSEEIGLELFPLHQTAGTLVLCSRYCCVKTEVRYA